MKVTRFHKPVRPTAVVRSAEDGMGRLNLLRQEKSLWNSRNRFNGWTDEDLSPVGIEEARIAGEMLRREEARIYLAYTSWLKRAIRTLRLVLDEIDRMWIPQKARGASSVTTESFGGMDKGEVARKLGPRS